MGAEQSTNIVFSLIEKLFWKNRRCKLFLIALKFTSHLVHLVENDKLPYAGSCRNWNSTVFYSYSHGRKRIL